MNNLTSQEKPKNLHYCNDTFPPAQTKILYDELKEGEKNLYIVSTPLQLLCAIEAQHHFNTQNNVLVILFFLIDNGKNIDQMFKISEHFPYNKLITYRPNKGINIKTFQNYVLELKKYDYNYLFLGYGTPIYRRMVANIKHNKLYMLDDGIHSITVHNQLHESSNNLLLVQEPKNIKKRLRNIIYFTKGIKVDNDFKDLNFFTMFDLPEYNDIVTHNFSYVRSIFLKDEQSDDKVYILGQPLKKAIEMKPSDYIDYLKDVLDKHKNKEIVYIPHRTEQISEELGFLLYSKKVLILHINSPIEIFFMNHGINPVDVYSFMSSALFTINKMFPESKPKYIEIDTSPYSEFHQENIQLIYDNYQKAGIEKFNIDRYGTDTNV